MEKHLADTIFYSFPLSGQLCFPACAWSKGSPQSAPFSCASTSSQVSKLHVFIPFTERTYREKILEKCPRSALSIHVRFRAERGAQYVTVSPICGPVSALRLNLSIGALTAVLSLEPHASTPAPRRQSHSKIRWHLPNQNNLPFPAPPLRETCLQGTNTKWKNAGKRDKACGGDVAILRVYWTLPSCDVTRVGVVGGGGPSLVSTPRISTLSAGGLGGPRSPFSPAPQPAAVAEVVC